MNRWLRSSGRGRGTCRRAVSAVAVAAAGLVLLSGCGFRGVNDLPLPGGAEVGDHPYQVKVHFKDVLDLVPSAGVRVNDVPVGRVEKVGLARGGSWLAEVTVTVHGDVKLPSNAVARLRQSSLLGEKYVELAAPPENSASSQLTDGDLIGVERTNRNPEVEEVLGALSMLLNGGGVAQLQDITKELNAALEGREGDVRGALRNLDELVAGLDAQRGDITRALDSVNRLSASLNNQRQDIDVALRDLEPGLRVLNEQRGQLVTMLRSLDRLSGVATDVVDKTDEDLVHNLKTLQPTLRQLSAAGSDLPKSFELLMTYPFTDYSASTIKGDYTNLYVNMDLNLSTILGNMGAPRPPGGGLPLPLPQPGAQQPGLLPGLLPAPKPSAPQPPPPEEDSGGGLFDHLFGGGA